LLHEAEARPMSLPQRVLVVAPTRALARELAAALKSAGYAPIVVSDFVVAKTLLEARPDFLISELKLGAYNGLHLAIRAAGQGTPAIIVGDADPVLQAEAERYKAAFLTTPLDPERVLVLMRRIPASSRRKRRSPRKQVAVLDAYANEVHARLLDVSYEGMRIEATENELAALPPRFTVRLPLFNFSCRVQRVWTARPSADGPGVACGAELSTSDADTAIAWRILVDSLPGAALTT
jgi:ActR/RegA family two-component response regulator